MKITMVRYITLVLVSFLALSFPLRASAFDHQHKAWTALLQEHVQWQDKGVASTVDYASFAKDRTQLDSYTEELSAVSRSSFDAWTRDQQLAFLINAYNAFTVELILDHYPEIDSIKDIGGWFGNPWHKEFFSLLGEQRNLDAVEHTLIRGSGRYNEPRIHVAVVCASIGCPALRAKAFVPDHLEQQLSDSMVRFLSDPSRNHFNKGVLKVSKIFHWYREDFPNLKGLFAQHAAQLSRGSIDRQKIRAGDYKLAFGVYDWSLNDRR